MQAEKGGWRAIWQKMYRTDKSAVKNFARKACKRGFTSDAKAIYGTTFVNKNLNKKNVHRCCGRTVGKK